MTCKLSLDELAKKSSDVKIDSIFEDILREKRDSYDGLELCNLQTIFEANMQDKSLFPIISTSDDFQDENTLFQIKEYLSLWCDKFLNYKLPSKHKGKSIQSPYDALIYRFLSFQSSLKVNADEMRKAHELAMQAENLIGDLLEEFIAKQTAQCGWIWCKGAVMVATDFYFKGKDDREVYLQIKNKFNTENSSSAKVRIGRNITKWNRLINKRIPETNEAESNWEELKRIMYDEVNITPSKRNDLSEASFAEFIEAVKKENPSIII